MPGLPLYYILFAYFILVLMCFSIEAQAQSRCATDESYPKLKATDREQTISIVRSRDRYYGRQTCYWRIETDDPCSVVKLRIHSNSGGVNYDKLTIYDGPTRDNILSKAGFPREVTSTGQFVFVAIFRHYPSHGPIYVSYTSVERETTGIANIGVTKNVVHDNCHSYVELLMSSYGQNFLASPGFRRNDFYRQSLRCSWLLVSNDPCYSVIKITFMGISTERGYDIIRIYDGPSVDSQVLGAFSGSEIPAPIISSGHQVFITFITDNSHNGQGFKLKFENTVAVPIFLPNVTKIQNENDAYLTVNFISTSPIRSVQWLMEGDLIYDDDNVTSTSVETCHIIYNLNQVHQSTLHLTSPLDEKFGSFKVSVKSDAGFAERIVRFEQPSQVANFGLPNVSMNTNGINIEVHFSVAPTFSVLQWFRESKLIDADDRNYLRRCTLNYKNNSTEFYVAEFSILSQTTEDYATYKLSVINKAGTADINIDIPFPSKYLPIFQHYDTKVKRDAIISANFSSDLGLKSIEWYKDALQITENKKYVISTDNENGKTQLKINFLTMQDFGTYKVSVTNSAGTTTQYIDLNKPKVFPAYTTCNQTKAIDISCVVDSCDETFLPWIHSINGTFVRYIESRIQGHTSTLTIPHCTGEDIGHYSCVTERTSPNGTKIVVRRDSSFIQPVASPLIGQIAQITMNVNSFNVSVNISSNPPPRYISWSKDDSLITGRKTLKKGLVQIPIRGTTVAVYGYTAALSILPQGNDDFGTYKIAVANSVGYAEQNIHLANPREDLYVVSHEVIYSAVDGNAVIEVKLFSFPKYQAVLWMDPEEDIPIKASSKYVITTERVSHHDIIRMKITDIRDTDFKKYKVIIRNGVAKTAYLITLKNPDEGHPCFHGESLMSVELNTAKISTNVTSEPPIQSVTWYKDNSTLSNGAKYNISTQKLPLKLIVGEIQKSGYQTAIQIADLNEQDYGMYVIRIKNSYGYTEKEVALRQGCGENAPEH